MSTMTKTGSRREMESKTSLFLYVAAVSANLVTFPVGGAFSWTSPVLPKLNGNQDPENNPFGEPITPFEESWITSLLNLGCVFGPFGAGFLADRFGRKRALLLFAVPLIISYTITAFARNVFLYYVARFICGLGAGCVFCVVPLYLGEIAEDSNRGLLGCLMCVTLTSGTLFSYVVGPYTSITVFSLVSIISVVLFVLIFGILIPETPYWYLMVGEEDGARASLKRLRSKSEGALNKELAEISRNVAEATKGSKGRFRDLCKSRGVVKGLIISIGLLFFQQFSGISVVLGYLQSIFDATGSRIPADASTIVVGVMQIIVSFLTSQLVDRLGRRMLLLISMGGCTISMGLLGTFFFLKDHDYDVSPLFWLPVACLILYIFAYNFGIGPLAWSMMGELFPPDVKAVASTLATSCCFVIAFLTTVFFPNILQVVGFAVSFWVFTVTCVVGIVFVAMVVPETKGRSLQEIQDDLNKA